MIKFITFAAGEELSSLLEALQAKAPLQVAGVKAVGCRLGSLAWPYHEFEKGMYS
jgi:hypothetical protein